jgi:hypothetical protein
MASALPEVGPLGKATASGHSLSTRGFFVPRRRPETVTLVRILRS